MHPVIVEKIRKIVNSYYTNYQIKEGQTYVDIIVISDSTSGLPDDRDQELMGYLMNRCKSYGCRMVNYKGEQNNHICKIQEQSFRFEGKRGRKL